MLHAFRVFKNNFIIFSKIYKKFNNVMIIFFLMFIMPNIITLIFSYQSNDS